MVWQVLEGLSRESAKRLRFVPGVVYVDEGAACGQSPKDRAEALAERTAILRAVGFPWHPVALEEVFGLPPSVLRGFAQELAGREEAYGAAVGAFLQQQRVQAAAAAGGPAQGEAPSPARPPSPAQTEALVRLFASVKTLTAKEELLQVLRTHLILHVARAHGYSKVLTGESCTRLAVRLLANLALGRGAFLAWDTGFSDERHGVVVARPMREHTLKEIAFYNRLFAVPSVFTPAVDTRAPESASIQRLVEAFLLRLQAQFPSTVSTVYRTSEKLAKASRDGRVADSPGARCLFCLCALHLDGADSAVTFAAETETPAAPHCSPGAGRAQGCCGGAGPCSREALRAQVAEQLCYGCRVNLKDLPSVDPLPPYILAEAQLRSQRAWVRREIEEFLIEDSEEEVQAVQS
ncbi:cytoplasmic tRNA 2-thiolation protein 2 isoform X2 [Dasypus novemcinctus]|nr:cytoplasmic tRNA 2-thiolation protein 2 isoform X2 [Dasypus novemcinctus]XP_058135565.1 cytoplasmic tRNA 2-thiolation protein 2 isoform X2 [Dasypus novemcinctus]